MQHTIFIGRRKTSVARVYLISGNGTVTINRNPLNKYFPLDTLQHQVKFPLMVTESEGKFDVVINVQGGGVTGQVEAARLAVSRALVAQDESLRTTLRSFGLLTRDPRMVERKKYGRPGARKRYQFSKR
ncbi:MAG: 30S ribosomal protein S9 [Ignavibacteria bacterium]|nr:30S ribosomal protein S9 [Ignavibacteria bacterium]